MATKILITGGTGLIGKKLSLLLEKEGYKITHLSRTSKKSIYETFRWNIENGYIEKGALNVDYIINLVGAGIADKRWTPKRKKIIYDSRIESTNLLFQKIKESGFKLKGFISASAIGYYGSDTGDELVDEESNASDEFISKVVNDWEKAADQFNELSIPVAKVRIGIVLAKDGGALKKISIPIRYGFGSPLGTGNQYMSWIHIDDLTRMIFYIIDKDIKGIYNAVAPNPVTNSDFVNAVAVIIKKPLIFPNVPGILIKILLGELSGLILGGNKVSGKKITEEGFDFVYKDIKYALNELLSVKS